MGMEYLMKKAWHPRTITNIEKVWKAEEGQRELNRRHEELKKKLLEERYHQQLKKMQVQLGLIPKSSLGRVDFLYEMSNTTQKSSEDYLKEQANKAGQKKERQLSKQRFTNDKCEQFTLLHQDPLFTVMKEEKRVQQEIKNNPVHMKYIYQDIDKMLDRDIQNSKLRRNRQRSRSLSEDDQTRSKKSVRSGKTSLSAKSELYREYLKDRLGPAVKQDEGGNIRPDFGKFRRQARNEYKRQREDCSSYQKLKEEGRKIRQQREMLQNQLRKREGSSRGQQVLLQLGRRGREQLQESGVKVKRIASDF